MAAKPDSRIRLSALAVVATAIGALVWAAGASALTLGSIAPPGSQGCLLNNEYTITCDSFQRKATVGQPEYRVPAGLWTITACSAEGAQFDGGSARIRVWRRAATPGQFELVKQSHVEGIGGGQHPIFNTSLKVREGDLLGLGSDGVVPVGYRAPHTGGRTEFLTPFGGSCFPYVTGVGALVGAGTSCSISESRSSLVNVEAELTPR